jgi:hypothetical protein
LNCLLLTEKEAFEWRQVKAIAWSEPSLPIVDTKASTADLEREILTASMVAVAFCEKRSRTRIRQPK